MVERPASSEGYLHPMFPRQNPAGTHIRSLPGMNIKSKLRMSLGFRGDGDIKKMEELWGLIHIPYVFPIQWGAKELHGVSQPSI